MYVAERGYSSTSRARTKCSGTYMKRQGRQPKFPCVSCNRGVTARSKAIGCDICQRWTHVDCTGFMTKSFYDKLVKEELEYNFTCNGCMNKDLPFLTIQISFPNLRNRHLQIQNYLQQLIRTTFNVSSKRDSIFFI